MPDTVELPFSEAEPEPDPDPLADPESLPADVGPDSPGAVLPDFLPLDLPDPLEDEAAFDAGLLPLAEPESAPVRFELASKTIGCILLANSTPIAATPKAAVAFTPVLMARRRDGS